MNKNEISMKIKNMYEGYESEYGLNKEECRSLIVENITWLYYYDKISKQDLKDFYSYLGEEFFEVMLDEGKRIFLEREQAKKVREEYKHKTCKGGK